MAVPSLTSCPHFSKKKEVIRKKKCLCLGKKFAFMFYVVKHVQTGLRRGWHWGTHKVSNHEEMLLLLIYYLVFFIHPWNVTVCTESWGFDFQKGLGCGIMTGDCRINKQKTLFLRFPLSGSSKGNIILHHISYFFLRLALCINMFSDSWCSSCLLRYMTDSPRVCTLSIYTL